MQKNNVCKSLIYSFFVLICVQLFVYNTSLSPFIALFIPPFAAYITYRFGIASGVLLSVFSILANAVTAIFGAYGADVTYSVLSALFLTFPCVLCAVLFVKRARITDVFVSITLIYCVIPVIYIAYVKYFGGINLSEKISDSVIRIFSSQLDIVRSVYPELTEILDFEDTQILSAMQLYIPGLIPSVMVIICGFAALLHIYIARMFCRRTMILNTAFSEGPDSIYFPRYNAIALFAFVLLTSFAIGTKANVILLNLIIIIVAAYIIQGLSLFDYMVKQKNTSEFVRIFAVIAAVIATTLISAFVPLFNTISVFTLLGISDSFADYRKLCVNEGESDENKKSL